PVLEHACPGGLRFQAVTEIFSHHRGHHVDVMSTDGFPESSDERLEINARLFLRRGLGSRGWFFLRSFLLGRWASGRAQRENRKQAENDGCLHDQGIAA